MTNLEDYIKKHKSELYSEELSTDHEFKFENKLKSQRHTKDRFLIKYSVAVAASVIIFVSSVIFIYVKKTEGYKGAVETSQAIELREAEQYYSEQTELALNQLKNTLSAQPEDVASPLWNELDSMANEYKQLKKDLKTNPDDIRLMSAIVQYHQVRLDLINNLIERFTLYSNTKIKHHENENI
jgi:hypothetical protein